MPKRQNYEKIGYKQNEKPGMTQITFAELELKSRIKKDSVLRRIDALINWQEFRPLVSGIYKRDESNKGGQEPFDGIQMLKVLILGQWHSLSDVKLEEALNVRLDFLEFCMFSLSDDIPDATTICRFRNRLVEYDRLDKILNQLNSQLQKNGLMLQEATAAVLDATLIKSAARPDAYIQIEQENNQDKVYEDGSNPGIEQVQSKDPDARWLKKGNRSYFGYRAHTVVEATTGFTKSVHTTSANVSEITQVEAILDKTPGEISSLLADKGYSSKANREMLKSRGIESGILHKAARGKPLNAEQKEFNKLISKSRYIIEQSYGIMKRIFKFERASYITKEKVHAQIVLKVLCINLLKGVNKILLIDQTKGELRPF